jgi:hypothetical protein
MSTGRYGSIKRNFKDFKTTGYNKAFFSLLDDFTTLQKPVLSATPVLGESETIGTAHVWANGKEPIALNIFADNAEAPADSIGAKGQKIFLWKPKIFIEGDGPKIQEIVKNICQEEGILFLQVGCDTTSSFLQFGCDCEPAKVVDNKYMSGTKYGSDKMGYELTFETTCRYFYKASVSERA